MNSNQLLISCSDFIKLILKINENIASFCNSFVRFPDDQQMVLGLLNMSDEYIDALDIDVMVADECDQFKVIEASPEFLAPDSEIPQGEDVTFEIIELPKYSGVGTE